jgi:hypothetical protein
MNHCRRIFLCRHCWLTAVAASGAGRVRLRPNRGVQRCLAYDLNPGKSCSFSDCLGSVRQRPPNALGVGASGQGKAGRGGIPDSDEPPPSLRRGFQRCHAYEATPENRARSRSVVAVTRPVWVLVRSGNGHPMPRGLALLCRARREAPAQTELRPTCAGASAGSDYPELTLARITLPRRHSQSFDRGNAPAG